MLWIKLLAADDPNALANPHPNARFEPRKPKEIKGNNVEPKSATKLNTFPNERPNSTESEAERFLLEMKIGKKVCSHTRPPTRLPRWSTERFMARIHDTPVRRKAKQCFTLPVSASLRAWNLISSMDRLYGRKLLQPPSSCSSTRIDLHPKISSEINGSGWDKAGEVGTLSNGFHGLLSFQTTKERLPVTLALSLSLNSHHVATSALFHPTLPKPGAEADLSSTCKCLHNLCKRKQGEIASFSHTSPWSLRDGLIDICPLMKSLNSVPEMVLGLGEPFSFICYGERRLTWGSYSQPT